MVFGFSSLVKDILIENAKRPGIIFSVIVTESRPNCEGYELCEILQDNGIPVKLILDSAIALAIEEADFVLDGAEAVVENGGIINKLGTYTCALCAKSLNKPLYIVTQSFKFLRIYPLS